VVAVPAQLGVDQQRRQRVGVRGLEPELRERAREAAPQVSDGDD
jgi:hypothetical protein